MATGSPGRFQELLLEGMSDSESLPAALEWLTEYCGAGTVQMIAVSDENLILDSAIFGSVDLELFSKEADYLAENPRTKVFDIMPTGRIFHDADLVDAETVRNLPVYQEFLIPARIGQFSGAILSRGEGHIVGLAIARPYEDGPFETDVIERFASIVQSALPVVQLAEQIVDTRASSLLDLFGPQAHVAILDREGVLLRYSEHFENLLSAGLIRRDHFGRLDMLSDEVNFALAAALRGTNGLAGGRFSFTRLRPERTFICTVTPVPALKNFGGRSGHAILVLDPLLAPKRLDRHLLRQAFILTDAECDVCERLYAGDTLAEIAVGREVAISTVKSLLKSILMKTGTRRQAEIIIKLSRFAFDYHD
ncbi:helix-turn-helix transcriptional regulator [Hyphomonas adhaerens]|uniref:helix-turn-helix transcriptional regulator n=1 Tax=Hyphomonas adhaerens TaxID=81029 RepID=UPI000C556011|nr:helix-turn-helix transcriptional regulator [Hyphomonas adhaerens]MBB40352.1 hypothetical protein [Hyphomonas sp.]|tara:strand:- start:1358 stop:2452 length:1095 start_codon:yes stop_codon:yes gene_type:complete